MIQHKLITNIALFLCILIVFSVSAFGDVQASDKVDSATADQFYGQCISKRDLRMSYETQETFCKCSAHQLQQNVTTEQFGELGSQDVNKLTEVMDRLTLTVFAPCLSYPVKDVTYDECTENDFHNDKGICGCLSKKMADYTTENATATLMKTIQSKPGVIDPLKSFLLNAKFRQYKKQSALTCVQEVSG